MVSENDVAIEQIPEGLTSTLKTYIGTTHICNPGLHSFNGTREVNDSQPRRVVR